MTFMLSQLSGEPEPYYFGEQLVIFLPAWSPTKRVFYVGGCCTQTSSSVLPVENGRIVRAPISGVSGMRVDDLLAKLRAPSAGQ